MAKKKSSNQQPAPTPRDKWIILTEIQVNGRHVVRGTELKISGERGRYRFIQHVTTEKGVVWIDVVGGPQDFCRSFSPDRIKTVHSKNKTDANMAIQYKKKRKDMKEEKSNESGNSTD